MSQAANRASIMLRRLGGPIVLRGALEHTPIPRIEAGQVGINVKWAVRTKPSCRLMQDKFGPSDLTSVCDQITTS